MWDEDDMEELPDYPGQERQHYSRRYAGETLGQVIQALAEYARAMEHEKSNRAEIERKRKTALTVIRSERGVMIQYLNHRFGERLALYQQYFQLIDTALEQQQEEVVKVVLENILNIYQDNPCAGLDDFRQQFQAISEVVHI
jgi:predicted hydrocarbon binding protein